MKRLKRSIYCKLPLSRTEVEASSLHWENVGLPALGNQTMLRLPGFDSIFSCIEVALLAPFEEGYPIVQESLLLLAQLN
jgi:hypothetical protein